MTQGSWGAPKVDNIDTSAFFSDHFQPRKESAIRRELRFIAEQFSDMSCREARRALRYKVRDFAKLYGVAPEVILQTINCSDVSQFIGE